MKNAVDKPTGEDVEVLFLLPRGSMYGIFTYIYHKKNQLNVGKYTIHGSYGLWK